MVIIVINIELNTKMKYLLLLLICILFSSCQQEERYLEIYYMKRGFTAFNIPCNLVNPPSYGTKNVKILDSEFINEFESLYNKLKNSNEIPAIDTRMRIIYHHGVNIDTICMGENFTILVNGQLKEDSPELLKLIKEKIYK